MAKSKRPIVAIMYDFDKTLATKDMQEFDFIPKLSMKSDEFWGKVTDLKTKENMDPVLAYMYVMLKEASNKKSFSHKGWVCFLRQNGRVFPWRWRVVWEH